MTLKFIDDRDKNEYKLVRVGEQLWFAENLCYRVEDCCFMYNNRYSSFEKNGYLYNEKALDEICPPGWRIPTPSDFFKLYKHFEDAFEKTGMVKILSGKLAINNVLLQLGGVGSESQECYSQEGEGAFFWTLFPGNIKQYCLIDSAGIKFRRPTVLSNLFSVRLVCGDVMTDPRSVMKVGSPDPIDEWREELL